jgi:hypothetical protein
MPTREGVRLAGDQKQQHVRTLLKLAGSWRQEPAKEDIDGL